MTPLLEKEGKVKINNVLTFSSSLRRSTLAEVPGGGGGLLIQPLAKSQNAGEALTGVSEGGGWLSRLPQF
jgi:hypothetical protein